MSDASTWSQRDALLQHALDLPEAEREAFLATLGDVEQAEHLRRLLQEVATQDDFLERDAASFAAPLVAEADPAPQDDLLEDAAIGAYQVLERIGQGGMGTVYRAARTDGSFEQTVALKVIKRGMDSEAIVRRFLQERQVLASLNHSHIARLLDGGTTEDGRPYFVMEFVAGEPLTTFADRNKRNVEARVKLFLAVCSAVQHAHQNLVVHRDLKPSNILVTAEGEVKLLDFGIAKVLATEEEEVPDLTRTGVRVMTPAYASPEQLQGQRVTTATDVYALGLILYELLTGHQPFEQAGRGTEATSRTDAPPRPSSRLQKAESTAEALSSVAAARNTTTERLRRQLEGDLDVVCLKALHQDVDRRYATVAALAEDLRNYLAGLPIAAQADTWGYRMGKFVKRHRFGVGTTVAGLLMLVVFAGVMFQQRNIAQAESEKAEAVKNFLSSILQQANPSASLGDTLRVLTILNEGAQRIGAELESQPEVQAEMMDIIGVMYWTLGQFAKADSFLTKALALRNTVGSPAGLAATQDHLAVLYDAQGQLAEADSLFKAAIQFWREDPAQYGVELAASLNNITLVYWRQAQFDEAIDYVKEALALREKLIGKDHPDYLTSLNNYALLLEQKGQYVEAEEIHREVVGLRKAQLGGIHPDLNISMNNLGVVLWRLGRYEEAEEVLREALTMAEALWGEHPSVAIRHNTLGLVLKYLNKYDEAETHYRAALAMNLKLLGEDHREIAVNYNNIATLLGSVGRGEEATAFYEKSLAVNRKLYGDSHPRVATTLNSLGDNHLKQENYAEAAAQYQKAREINEAYYGKDDVRVGLNLAGLGAVAFYEKQYAKAQTSYTQAHVIFEKVYPAGHDRTAGALTKLSQIALAQGNVREAETLLDQAVGIYEKVYSEPHLNVALADNLRGQIRLAQAQYEQAEPLLRTSYEAILNDPAASDRAKTQARGHLQALYQAWGKPEQARLYE